MGWRMKFSDMLDAEIKGGGSGSGSCSCSSSSTDVFWSDIKPSSTTGDLYIYNMDTEATATTTNLVIKKKIISMLEHLKFSSAAQNVLVQFWAPITTEGRCFLATSDQPFAISCCNEKLYEFKKLCMDHKFYVDTETEKELSLIGRVFLQKSPELLPDADPFSGKTYPPPYDVFRCNVQVFVALPVLEPFSQACLGVIEMVFPLDNMHSSNYRHLTNSVLDGLQKVDLQSSVEYNHFDKETCDEGLKHALHEISKVLKVACKTLRLPLVQTWLPCRDYSGGSPKSTSILRVSSKAVASYSHFANEFEWASQMVGLQEGQGVAGRAYSSHRPWLTNDLSEFSLVEYPLARYAQDCKLNCCFAICLRSSYTGDNDYVLEFFIPCGKGQLGLRLASLLATLKRNFRSFKFASGQELGEELSVEVINSFSFKSLIKVKALDYLIDDFGDISPMPSSSQELAMEDTDIMTAESKKEDTSSSDRKIIPTISYEVLERHFELNLEVAAEKLGVTPSTLKRVCRQHGISRWPSHKRNKIIQTTQTDHPPSSSKRPFEPAATLQESVSSSETPPEQAEVSSEMQYEDAGEDTVRIMATFGDLVFEFKYPLSSVSLADLEEELAKRAKLKVGTFRIKYIFEADFEVLVYITHDTGLKSCMTWVEHEGITTLRMFVEPVAPDCPF